MHCVDLGGGGYGRGNTVSIRRVVVSVLLRMFIIAVVLCKEMMIEQYQYY
jgi:hypothetical protein